MKILFLTNRNIDKSTDLQYLQNIADIEHDVHLIKENEDAKKFISERLINSQKHLDAIIVDLESDEDNIIEELAIWIRNEINEYSFRNFQLKQIPIILYKKPELWRTYRNNLFDKVIFNNTSKETREKEIGKTYDYWLNKLGADLENLNLDTNLLFSGFDSAWMLSHRFHKLSILTENFIAFPRKLDYLWFGNNLNELDISFNDLYDLLKRTEINKNLRIEKEFHQYLKENSAIMKIDRFQYYKYEPHLYYENSRKYIEPDFINFPSKLFIDYPEVFEVKNPNQQIMKTDGTLYRNTIKAIKQVNEKYMNYLNNTANKKQLESKLSYNSNTFNYTLLIGRNSSKEENEYWLNKFIDNPRTKLSLITYDGLIERYEKIQEKIKRHRII